MYYYEHHSITASANEIYSTYDMLLQAILKNIYDKFNEGFTSKEGENTSIDIDIGKAMFKVRQGKAPELAVNVKLTSSAFEPNYSEDEIQAEYNNKV